MRRSITVIIGGGLLLGGALPVGGTALGAQPGGTVAHPGATAERIVVYGGYEIEVPASWPVYRLGAASRQCVRYDRHAVYLGMPGVNQQCPAGLIGRTETVSILPRSAGPQASGTARLTPASSQLPGVRGAVLQDTGVHELQVIPAESAAGAVTVLATYGGGRDLIERVLATLRPVPAVPAVPVRAAVPAVPARAAGGSPTVPPPTVPPPTVPPPTVPPPTVPPPTVPPPTVPPPTVPPPTVPPPTVPPPTVPAPLAAFARLARPVPARAAAQQAALIQQDVRLPTASTGAARQPAVPQLPTLSPSWSGLPFPWPTQIVESAPAPVSPRPPAPLLGFDACATPSLATMKAWRRGYAATGIYIGGVNAACYSGNLSASWITSVAAMGWSMLPAYVGPQAPCYGYGTMITPSHAAQEGTAAADDAASDAWRLGLPAKSPIYYDMEAYNSLDSACRSAVLTFLSAWTRELNAKRYVSGIYSSLDSGIADLQTAARAAQPGFTPPQAVWYAKWDNKGELNDGNLTWPSSDRDKQFIGPHNVTLGGITINIDTDLVAGPTAR